MLLFVLPAPPPAPHSLSWEADLHGECEQPFLLSGVWLGLANGGHSLIGDGREGGESHWGINSSDSLPAGCFGSVMR